MQRNNSVLQYLLYTVLAIKIFKWQQYTHLWCTCRKSGYNIQLCN